MIFTHHITGNASNPIETRFSYGISFIDPEEREEWIQTKSDGRTEHVFINSGIDPNTSPGFQWARDDGRSYKRVGSSSSGEESEYFGMMADQQALQKSIAGGQLLVSLGELGLAKETAGLDRERFDLQKGILTKAEARSQKLWDVYQKEYLPGELAWVQESFAGIPAGQAVAEADADVGAAFDKAGQVQGRNLERLGIDPSSPRYAAQTDARNLDRARTTAGARNAARRNIRDINYERRRQATTFGRGVPTQASGIASAGSSALGQPGSLFNAAGSNLNAAAGNIAGAGASVAQGFSPFFSFQENNLQRSFLGGENALDRSLRRDLADDGGGFSFGFGAGPFKIGYKP